MQVPDNENQNNEYRLCKMLMVLVTKMCNKY